MLQLWKGYAELHEIGVGDLLLGAFRPVNFCGKTIFFPLPHIGHRMMEWPGVEGTLKTI